jgi:hypothetical protein
MTRSSANLGNGVGNGRGNGLGEFGRGALDQVASVPRYLVAAVSPVAIMVDS